MGLNVRMMRMSLCQMQDEQTHGATDASSSSQPSPFVPPPKPPKREKLSVYSPTEDTFTDTANLVKEDSEIWPSHTTHPQENTKKHSLCTESIFICSLHTTEIKLRLFFKQKTSINENRLNVWIAYGKETLPSDTLYANSCCMILFLLLLWCHICISLHWCCWRRMLWIFCTFVNWKDFVW